MPITEPVTLQEAKQQCRVDHDEDDELILSYITGLQSLMSGRTSKNQLVLKSQDCGRA